MKKAQYKGFALVNRPSNQFFILFRATKEEVEDILEKIVPVKGKLEIVEVEVKDCLLYTSPSPRD